MPPQTKWTFVSAHGPSKGHTFECTTETVVLDNQARPVLADSDNNAVVTFTWVANQHKIVVTPAQPDVVYHAPPFQVGDDDEVMWTELNTAAEVDCNQVFKIGSEQFVLNVDSGPSSARRSVRKNKRAMPEPSPSSKDDAPKKRKVARSASKKSPKRATARNVVDEGQPKPETQPTNPPESVDSTPAKLPAKRPNATPQNSSEEVEPIHVPPPQPATPSSPPTKSRATKIPTTRKKRTKGAAVDPVVHTPAQPTFNLQRASQAVHAMNTSLLHEQALDRARRSKQNSTTASPRSPIPATPPRQTDGNGRSNTLRHVGLMLLLVLVLTIALHWGSVEHHLASLGESFASYEALKTGALKKSISHTGEVVDIDAQELDSEPTTIVHAPRKRKRSAGVKGSQGSSHAAQSTQDGDPQSSPVSQRTTQDTAPNNLQPEAVQATSDIDSPGKPPNTGQPRKTTNSKQQGATTTQRAPPAKQEQQGEPVVVPQGKQIQITPNDMLFGEAIIDLIPENVNMKWEQTASRNSLQWMFQSSENKKHCFFVPAYFDTITVFLETELVKKPCKSTVSLDLELFVNGARTAIHHDSSPVGKLSIQLRDKVLSHDLKLGRVLFPQKLFPGTNRLKLKFLDLSRNPITHNGSLCIRNGVAYCPT